LLQAEGLAAFRGERLVFRDVGFSLEAGEALLLTGPNGSGKSTLLRLLAGLLRPAAGTLRWNGEDALADLSTHARRVGYVGHLDAIKPGLTAAENLAFAARLSDGSVPDALAGMGLEELADLPGRMLSAGQRRRLADRFGRALEAHRAGGGVVVAATHLPLPVGRAAELALG